MSEPSPSPKKKPDTRCDQGDENIVSAVTVSPEDEVTLQLILCKASFHVAIDLDEKRLVNEPQAEDEVVIHLDPLSPGLHGLSWSFMSNATPWKVQSELFVNGLLRYRQRKGSDSTFPFEHLFMLLRVR